MADRVRDPSADRPAPAADPAHRLPTDSAPARPGAYGLHLPTLRDAGDLLVQAPAQWTDWRIVLADGSGSPEEFVEDSRARIRSAPSGWVDVDRAQRTSTMHLPRAPNPAEIAQPFLGSTAVVAAHWMGLHSFHAGAFVADGRAWAILGTKGAGKSSLLAALSLRGLAILADDVLVVDERLHGLAGPRCIDLRHETSATLSVGETLGVVGTRERWRMGLKPVEPEVPLGGWIHLEWGEPEIVPVPAQERVEALFANLALRAQSHDPAVLSRLMEMFALPMLCVRRPRDIDRIDETAERLRGYLAKLVD